jgi:hypothetical protein
MQPTGRFGTALRRGGALRWRREGSVGLCGRWLDCLHLMRTAFSATLDFLTSEVLNVRWLGIVGSAVGHLLSSSHAVAQSAEACGSTPAGDARPIDWQGVESLAGTYDLVLVDTASSPTMPRRRSVPMRLWVPDSAQAAGLARWSLTGALGFEDSSLARQRPAIYVPRPDVGLVGRTLYLGQVAWNDGVGDVLHPAQVNERGFWGSWGHTSGLGVVIATGSTEPPPPEPAGYFCAWRAPTAQGP